MMSEPFRVASGTHGFVDELRTVAGQRDGAIIARPRMAFTQLFRFETIAENCVWAVSLTGTRDVGVHETSRLLFEPLLMRPRSTLVHLPTPLAQTNHGVLVVHVPPVFQKYFFDRIHARIVPRDRFGRRFVVFGEPTARIGPCHTSVIRFRLARNVNATVFRTDACRKSFIARDAK